MIVALSLGSYFAAQYIEYVELAPQYEDGTPVGFTGNSFTSVSLVILSLGSRLLLMNAGLIPSSFNRPS